MTLFASLLIVALWFDTAYLAGSFMSLDVTIPLSVAVLAGASALVSIIALLLASRPGHLYVVLAGYLLLATTVLALIWNSGHVESSYTAAWIIIALFGGIFGGWAILPLTVAVVGYGVYLNNDSYFTDHRALIFLCVYLLPILIGFLMWHRRSDHENEKDKAYSALARELSQVANKSDIVINAIADGVVAIDHKGIIQLINPAGQKLIGWNASDAMGLDYRSVLKIVNDKGESLDEEVDIIQQVLRTNITTNSDEFTLVTNAGKKILVDLSVSPVGSLGSGAIIVFRDITDAVAEERQQAEFISTASHEMRTPVASIEGYLGLALNPQTATIDDKARVYLTKAHEAAQHLGRLFQDLLDISKAEDGRLKSNPQVIDVSAFARDIVMSMTPQAAEKNLAMIYKPDLDQINATRIIPMFYILADADHLREVLGNLIENAVKYTRQGDVTVDVTGTDETVTITVTDTGIGIPPEDLPHLFQKFYRVDSTDTREIGGTGLGLYLSRRLTETMSGHIDVSSEYGKGSVFTLEFSRLSHEEATQRIEENSVEQSQA
jgi:PAS domain S-box-containing protein